MSQDNLKDWTPKPRNKWSVHAPHWSNDIDPQFACPICVKPMMVSGSSHRMAVSVPLPSIEFSLDYWICTDDGCEGCCHGERVSGKMFDDDGEQVTPKVMK